MDKKLKATHEGNLVLNEFNISAYNLPDGERVLSRIGFLKAIGRTGKAKGGRQYDDEFKTPIFLSANNLKPLLTEEILENSKPILFTDLNGNDSIGYRAELLPQVAHLFSVAYHKNMLKPNQKHIGIQSDILVKAFLKISITSLVDEATGYQYEREKDELQKILKQYISEELLPWQKRFPDIFYKELFRLNEWDFTVNGIKKRPGVIGTWTKKLVYEQLPKGVLNELEKNVPKSNKGNKTARFHQLLTDDIGNPHLTAQINQIVTLFQLSDNMKHMWEQFERLKLRQSGQMELPFNFDEKGHTIEPIEKNNLSDFNQKLKKGLDYNPKED
ncbi:P63C domain-containing protein [Tenacibaculum sp. L6]|uniref:P63C domain-containing protein n=1 Tax=Tenacibaculum sp. L6 TaxID=2992764 RepID=UPI00237AE753|nr:P63C domain-containing protein [Tenacibaculum sp. L6]MDE0536937.1 P63C domain-containing protein [Tenacibaculum sp. L6]